MLLKDAKKRRKGTFEKRLIAYSAAAGAGLLGVGAWAKADFIGSYDVMNWTTTITAGTDGSVDTSGAPAAVTLNGSNNGTGGNTDFTITVVGTGNVTFDWLFQNNDSTPGFDSGGFLLNGVYTALSSSLGTTTGSETVPVIVGDEFGFRADSADGIFGRGSLTITNFNAPQQESVPEPASLMLLAAGAAGGALLFRRRRQAAQ